MHHQVWHPVSICLHVLVAAAGFACLYVAFFIYRDERNQLQNSLVNFWSYVSGQQERFLAKQAGFLIQSAKFAEAKLTWLLGKEPLSLFSINVSAWLSFASYGCVYFYKVRFLHYNPASTSALLNAVDYSGILIYTVFSLFVGLYLTHRLADYKLAQYLILIGLPVTVFAAIYLDITFTERVHDWLEYGMETGTWRHMDAFTTQSWRWDLNAYYFKVTGDVVAGILCGVLVDVLTLALIRKLISKPDSSSRLPFLLFTAIVNCSIVFGLLYGLVRFLNTGLSVVVEPGFHMSEWIASTLLFASGTNLFVLLASSSMLLVALAAVLHWLVWPALGRSIYALVDNRIVENKKILGTLGALLIGIGLPILKPAISWVESWLK